MTQTYNIVNPKRPDFADRVVSEDSPVEDRAGLVAKLRALIELRGTISVAQATKAHTAEELTEMGFVSLTMADYGPDELNFRVYEKVELPEALNPDGLNYE